MCLSVCMFVCPKFLKLTNTYNNNNYSNNNNNETFLVSTCMHVQSYVHCHRLLQDLAQILSFAYSNNQSNKILFKYDNNITQNMKTT